MMNGTQRETEGHDFDRAQHARLLLGLPTTERHDDDPDAWSIEDIQPLAGLSPKERLVRVFTTISNHQLDAIASLANIDPREAISLAESAAEKLAIVPRHRAVILEDDWLSRRDLEIACAQSGLDIVCSTADPALTIAATLAFDPAVALIDLEIARNPFAGEIVALRLREIDRSLRIVLVTASRDAEQISALISNSGALLKPFAKNDLDRELASAVT